MNNAYSKPLALAGAFFFLLLAAPLAAQSELLKLEAVASYYGAEFNGRPTSSGELFDMNDLTAAHKTLPFGTILEVTNLENGKKVTVRVNDRGPFTANRELDVSKAAAEAIGMIATGTARVSLRKLAGPDAAPQAAPQVSAPQPAPTKTAAPQAGASPLPASPSPQAAESPATVSPRSSAEPASPGAGAAPYATPAAAKASGASWRIQLGSFSKEENATRLVVRLRGDGFNPSFEKSETLIRVVLAGVSGQELAGMRTKLENAGYSGFLVRQESW